MNCSQCNQEVRDIWYEMESDMYFCYSCKIDHQKKYLFDKFVHMKPKTSLSQGVEIVKGTLNLCAEALSKKFKESIPPRLQQETSSIEIKLDNYKRELGRMNSLLEAQEVDQANYNYIKILKDIFQTDCFFNFWVNEITKLIESQRNGKDIQEDSSELLPDLSSINPEEDSKNSLYFSNVQLSQNQGRNPSESSRLIQQEEGKVNRRYFGDPEEEEQTSIKPKQGLHEYSNYTNSSFLDKKEKSSVEINLSESEEESYSLAKINSVHSFKIIENEQNWLTDHFNSCPDLCAKLLDEKTYEIDCSNLEQQDLLEFDKKDPVLPELARISFTNIPPYLYSLKELLRDRIRNKVSTLEFSWSKEVSADEYMESITQAVKHVSRNILLTNFILKDFSLLADLFHTHFINPMKCIDNLKKIISNWKAIPVKQSIPIVIEISKAEKGEEDTIVASLEEKNILICWRAINNDKSNRA
ncbi:unnamed protein product [Moneuplotes crassus]|uniref:Uncharacterized protein n=1 Tax=Euplotes crassus TaxID=5936 RepID=A0AAD1U0K5_EUPCR|nr:unnamed protein product [Moneuplotes crassus]